MVDPRLALEQVLVVFGVVARLLVRLPGERLDAVGNL
jgi:hypothetical protein